MSLDPKSLEPTHFIWSFDSGVATITLNRPERKNPLTFDSYAEIRDTFAELAHTPAVKSVVLTGAGGNFCSGGDVHDIIGPLTKMDASGLLQFTRMTGDLVRAMRASPQPIVAAVEGVCAGAGAILAMASDLRFASPDAKTAFLFTRVGLSGADMGACAILPRIIGHGRAAELLFTGRNWRGTAFGGARGRTDVPKIVDWYMDGKIQIDPMITHVLKLEEINQGFDLMHAGESIRSVVVY